MEFQSFDSLEEMMKEIENARVAADGRVKSWQSEIKPGDFFIQETNYGFFIFGEVLEADDEFYRSETGRNYRLCRCYSVACVEGECGDVHVSEDDRVGELLPMLELTNSENGLGSLQLHAGIFRLVCSNGLMVSVNEIRTRWIHSGNANIEAPDFRAVLGVSQDYTQRLDASHAIYLSAAQKINMLEMVSANLGMKVGAAFVRRANKEYHGAPEMFSLINSLTAAAHDFPAIERTRIESYAASFLN